MDQGQFLTPALQESFRRRSGQPPSTAGIPGQAPAANAQTAANPLAGTSPASSPQSAPAPTESPTAGGREAVANAQPNEASLIVKALSARLKNLPPA